MDVSVRDLRNHTARVIAAVEAGERIVLTKHGRPVADIVPRETRVHSMPNEVFLAHLEEIRRRWEESGVTGDPSDYDVDDAFVPIDEAFGADR
jgi:prevent-host-death family protein